MPINPHRTSLSGFSKNLFKLFKLYKLYSGMAAACLTPPPPCLNIVGLKNKKYTPLWEQRKEKFYGAIQTYTGELEAT